MTDAVSMYEKKARDIWLFDYPAQVSLCGTQVNLRFSVQKQYICRLKCDTCRFGGPQK